MLHGYHTVARPPRCAARRPCESSRGRRQNADVWSLAWSRIGWLTKQRLRQPVVAEPRASCGALGSPTSERRVACTRRAEILRRYALRRSRRVAKTSRGSARRPRTQTKRCHEATHEHRTLRPASSACCCPAWARSPPRSSPAACSRAASLASPIGSLTQLGHDPARQAHRQPRAAIARVRAAGRARRARVRRLGPLPGQRLRGRAQRRGADARAPRPGQGRARARSSRCRRCSSPSTSSACAASTSRRETNKRELVEAVRDDIRELQAATTASSRCVAVWCGSTEVHHEPQRGAQLARTLRARPRRERSRASARR